MDPVALALAKSWAEGQFGDSRIVEMGSNSNGTYVRWENGLQICAGYGPHSRTDGARWTYPAAFIAVPYVLAVPRYKSAWRAFMVLIGTRELTNTYAAAAVYDTTGSSTQAETDTVELYWFAMGRWK